MGHGCERDAGSPGRTFTALALFAHAALAQRTGVAVPTLMVGMA